mgnify:CR=1 FL=1
MSIWYPGFRIFGPSLLLIMFVHESLGLSLDASMVLDQKMGTKQTLLSGSGLLSRVPVRGSSMLSDGGSIPYFSLTIV